MPNILTPVSLWNNFDDSLELNAEKVFEGVYNGLRVERVTFFGRDTGSGRVKIAAAFAGDITSPNGTVLILPDSSETIDIETVKFFVNRGYSALMVDYRGESSGCEFYTLYPENISYANAEKCGRYKDFVDDSADKTSWYEWVAVGLYARKYILERTGKDNVAVVGIRDGGELAWKLAVAADFKCIIPVCAAGWKAYGSVSKYAQEEVTMDEERYRFIAGVDSQAYAPYVKCPVLMLCSTNDEKFDYDRAYDTFSRINPNFVKESAIAYSMQCHAVIGSTGVNDMFLFLDRNLKNRQVFIPKPVEVFVELDDDSNLIARTAFDEQGVVEKCDVFLAEDSTDSAVREWAACPVKDESKHQYFLNIYEKVSTIFVICRVKYLNGFTVWSKVAVKKISGKFRNMQTKFRVVYSDKNGTDGFSVSDSKSKAVGGIFLADDTVMPKLVTKARGIAGIYSKLGLTTYRMSNPQYSANSTNLLSIDMYCDTDSKLTLTFRNVSTGEDYVCNVAVVGGVWQSSVFESKSFKTSSGAPMPDFTGDLKFTVTCSADFAVNNIMWL